MSDQMVVWKMELNSGLRIYAMPKGARVLSVGLQRDKAQLWFACDPETAEKESRQFLLTGTGYPFGAQDYKFIGTMMTPDQAFVFHVFEAVL